MSNNQEDDKKGWFRQGNRLVITAAVVTTLTIGGVVGVQAIGNSGPYKHMQVASAYKAAWHGGKSGDHKRFSEMSEAEINGRVERMVKHVAIEIDATTVQQEKITDLVTALAKDLKPVHARMRAAGKEIHGMLLADTIDRQALETLGAARLVEAEQISKDLVKAIADVAEVLTVEQRQLLDERIKEFRGMRRGWHRG